MDQEFKARAGSEREAYKSIVNQVHAYLRRTSRTRHYWEIQRTEWKPTELFGGGELKAHVWIKDSKMTKNSVMKFIDSCVGNIARKIEDEFRESDHPRDKGGKFTSKGNEGRGGSTKASKVASKQMKTNVQVGGDTDGIKEEAAEYGVKATIGKTSHGETTVYLSGNKEDIRRYAEEKIYGAEEEAREFSPELYEEDDDAEERGGTTQAERRMMGKQKESGTTKSSVKPSKALKDDIQDNLRQIAEQAESRDEFIEQAKSYVEDYVADDLAGDDESAQDNYGMSSEDVAKYVEDFVKNQLEKEADDWGLEEDDDEEDDK